MYPTSSRRLYVALANAPFPTQRGWYHFRQPSQETRVGSSDEAWQWQCGPRGGELGGRAVLIARGARRRRRFRWEAEEGVVVVGFGMLVVVVFVGDVVGEVVGDARFIEVNWEVSDWGVYCRDSFVLGREWCWSRRGPSDSGSLRYLLTETAS
jgi:hypothetical protein